MFVENNDDVILHVLDDMIETELDKHNLSRVDEQYIEDEVQLFVEKYSHQLENDIDSIKEVFFESDSSRSTAEKVADKVSNVITEAQKKAVEKVKDTIGQAASLTVGTYRIHQNESDIDLSKRKPLHPREVMLNSATKLGQYRVLQDFGADLTRPHTIHNTLEEMLEKLVYDNDVFTEVQKVTFAVYNLGMPKDKEIHISGKALDYMEEHIPNFDVPDSTVGIGLMAYRGSEHNYIIFNKPKNKFAISRSVRTLRMKTKASNIIFDREVDMESLQKFVDYDFGKLIKTYTDYIRTMEKENTSFKKALIFVLDAYLTGKAIDWSVGTLKHLSFLFKPFLAKVAIRGAGAALYWLYVFKMVKALYFVLVTRTKMVAAFMKDVAMLGNPYPLVKAVTQIKRS